MRRNTSAHAFSPMNAAANKYKVSRTNLLLVAIFSIINVLMIASGEFTYFLFSATVPYIIVSEGMYLCGKLPEEIYGEEYGSISFYDDSLLTVLIIIALAIIAFYVLCYFLSSKGRVGWIITALTLFIIDTVVMFWYYGFTSGAIDIIFHIWVIVCLCLGVSAQAQMKKLAAEEGDIVITAPEKTEGEEATSEQESDETIDEEPKTIAPDSTALRPADLTKKGRILLEAEVYGHKIIYRRVKKTNELVIDGDVYGEYVALLEKAHMLTARIGGHDIAAGFDGISSSYLSVDGNLAATKVRVV